MSIDSAYPKHDLECPLPFRDSERQGMPAWLLAHLHDPKLPLLRKHVRVLLNRGRFPPIMFSLVF
jgi:hypothetical protein